MIPRGFKLIKVRDPSLKWGLSSEFQPQKDCFIVSDVKTKLTVEAELLERHKALPGLCVLRAGEFYSEIFCRLNLDWNLNSDVFVEELFSEFCEEQKETWIKNLKGSSRFFELFNVLLPLLLHPEGPALFEEWSQNKQKAGFFKSLLDLSQQFFETLKSKKNLHESSLKALLFHYLPNLNGLSFPKDRIFVDLAFSLDLCEKEIFQEISRHREVCVLSPELTLFPDLVKSGKPEDCLNVYQKMEEELAGDQIFALLSFLGQGQKEQKLVEDQIVSPSSILGQRQKEQKLHEEPSVSVSSSSDQKKQERNRHVSTNSDRVSVFSSADKGQKGQETKRQNPTTTTLFFKVENKSTPLEEIRKATAQIQQWKDEGIKYRDMAVFAPRIEDYWFALRLYLEREGIPFKKSVTDRAGNFPDISYFLSAIRIHLGYLHFVDLERFVFYKQPKEGFSDFKSHYFHVPQRSTSKGFLFQGKSRSAKAKMTGREFVKWALSFWPKEGSRPLLDEKVLPVLENFPMEGTLKASQWLKMLESNLSSSEVELQEENSEGISCLSFNALSSVQSPYIFIMGLDEQSLKIFSTSVFSDTERESLLRDLNFPLPLIHPQEKEDSLLWFLQSSHLREVYLSCPSYSFKGEALNKSPLYLLSDFWIKAETKEMTRSPQWDQNRKSDQWEKNVSQILSKSLVTKEAVQNIEEAFCNPRTAFFHSGGVKLSSSRLKTYTKCPFKYAGEKLFCAPETNAVTQELSSLSKGSVAHKLFERFLKTYPQLSASPDQIRALINKVVEEEIRTRDQWVYEKQLHLVREDLKSLLDSFIEKEKKDRDQYLNLQPEGLEVEFSVIWDQNKESLLAKEAKEAERQYEFTGRIDRIDRDQENGAYVLRDYKMSGHDLTHASTWQKEGKEDLQLTFYAHALQKGLLEGFPAGRVQGLFYSVYSKDFSVKGFVDKASPLADLMDRRSGIKKEQEILNQAIVRSNQRLKEIVQNMEEGRFFPEPHNDQLCEKCFYRTWCRIETLKKE